MGDTMDALGYKADVPARARESVSEKVDSVRSRITGAGSQISEATPDAQELKRGAREAVGLVQENPLGLAIGAAAIGFLTGMLVPSTKVEDERIGPVADEVKEQARQTGQEALEHGRQITQEAVETAAEKAQEAASEVKPSAQEGIRSHAHEVGESARESVQQVQESATTVR
jgi:ElaB/YqjD/DUF883 family membrane-anchored ribosome-binding protein